MKKTVALLLSMLILVGSVMPVAANTVTATTACTTTVDSIKRGDTLTVTVSLENCAKLKSMALTPVYDSNVFELISGEWLLKDAILSNFDMAKGNAAIAFSAEKDANGNVFEFTLKVKETAPFGTTSLKANPIVKNDPVTIECQASEKTVTVSCVHNFDNNWSNDANQHWKACLVTGCDEKSEMANHAFDNDCDTVCNVCGYTRTITHNYLGVWSKDGTNHWHECAVCGDKKDTAAHSGGTATCLKKAVCTVCDGEYGNFGAHNYTETVDSQYLKSAATCGSKAVYYKSCSVCGEKGTETFEDGEYDYTNHAGETYKKNPKEATCLEEGYTGDVYCRTCDREISKGEIIPKSAHNPASVWSTDDTNHWKECQTVGCGNLIDKAPHSGGEATCTKKAVCSVCEVEYGDIDASNHKHTEVREAKAATEQEKGYTGDTWCLDCNKMIEEGKEVEKLEHKPVLVKAEAATAAKEGNIEHYYCENCGKYYSDEAGTKEIAKETTAIAKLAPKIIDGNNAKIDKSSKEPVSFRSDAAFADFIRVELDGKELVRDKDYTVKEGSIIATLTSEFAATLTAGEHTLGIVSESGTAVANFTVTADSAGGNSGNHNTEKVPQTGDNSNMILWCLIAVISLAALCTTSVISKKKKVR